MTGCSEAGVSGAYPKGHTGTPRRGGRSDFSSSFPQLSTVSLHVAHQGSGVCLRMSRHGDAALDHHTHVRI